MSEPRWLTHGLSVGRFEFRRSVRSGIRSGRVWLGVVFATALPTLAVLLVWFALRGEVPATSGLSLPDVARSGVVQAWLFGLLVVAQRTASLRPRPDARPLMLTTVSARTVATGLWVAETLRVLSYVALPLFLATLAAADLLGAPTLLVTVPLAAVLLAAALVAAGSLAGYLVALLVARVPILARYGSWIGGGLAFAGYLLVFNVLSAEHAVLSAVPLAWLADLAVLGSPVSGVPWRAAAGALTAVAVVGCSLAAIEWTVTRLWYETPGSHGQRSDDEASVSGTARPDRADRDEGWIRTALSSGLSPLPSPSRPLSVAGPTASAAEMAVLTTERNPRRLTAFLVPVTLVGFVVANSAVQAGRVTVVAVALAAVGLPWLCGALFTLNPFGDHRSVLSTVLVAAEDRAFVRGLALPGVVYGLPVSLVVTLALGVLSPLALLPAASLVVLSGYLTVVAAVLCPAVGMAFPRFSPVSVGRSRESLPPRTAAVLVSLLLVVVPGGYLALLLLSPATARAVFAGLVGLVPANVLAFVGGWLSLPLAGVAEWFVALAEAVERVPVGTFQGVTTVAVVAGGIGAAAYAYRYALRAVDDLMLP